MTELIQLSSFLCIILVMTVHYLSTLRSVISRYCHLFFCSYEKMEYQSKVYIYFLLQFNPIFFSVIVLQNQRPYICKIKFCLQVNIPDPFLFLCGLFLFLFLDLCFMYLFFCIMKLALQFCPSILQHLAH